MTGEHRFEPLPLDDAVALFADAPFRWWICGGNALDLHLGTSWRAHDDLDVGIVRADAPAVFRRLAGWDLHVAAGGHLAPWDGRPLRAGTNENNVWVRRSPTQPWVIDVTVGSGSAAAWVYRRDPAIALPWDDAVLRSPGGVPYLAPEIQLLFKSRNHRPKDDADAARVIPYLEPERIAFLDRHLPPGHPWRGRLADTRGG